MLFVHIREKQLNALLRLYEENEDAMCDALAKDLHKHRQESIINEIELLRNDVRNLIMNFRSYAQVDYVSICILFSAMQLLLWSIFVLLSNN